MIEKNENNGVLENYDREHNQIYFKIFPQKNTTWIKSKGGTINLMCNFATYDINKNVLSHFFKENKPIIDVIYETAYNNHIKQIEFHSHHFQLFNNQEIEKRELANVLFVIVQGKEKESIEIWKSDRNLDNKVFIKKIDKSTEWKIDVYNQKIFFIDRVGDQVKVDFVNWIDDDEVSENN